MFRARFVVLALFLISGEVSYGAEQARQSPSTLIAAQQQSMVPLSSMDGLWRGKAWTVLPSGEKHTITQTERIGTFLDGSVRVIEGRGYEPDGKVAFNALGIISFNPATNVYTLHSYAMGHAGDFVLTLTPEGFVWEIPAGPMTIRVRVVMMRVHERTDLAHRRLALRLVTGTLYNFGRIPPAQTWAVRSHSKKEFQ